MSRIRREPRLTPPWPPGLESLKKSFLGPRRHRKVPPPGTQWTMYDDSLPVALSINAFLKGESSFSMKVVGMEIEGVIDLGLRPDPAEARSLLEYLIDGKPLDSEELHRCEHWQIRIHAVVDKVLFEHRSNMVQAGGKKLRLSTSWQTAFKTLRVATRRVV